MSTRKKSSALPNVPLLRLARGEEYRVLSVIQPWAWAIIFAGKDVENRSWRTHYRGRLLIHASGTRRPRAEMEEHRKMLAGCAKVKIKDIPEEFGFSQILGSVELSDCREDVRSNWAEDDAVHWQLIDHRRLAVPVDGVTGARGLWRWTL